MNELLKQIIAKPLPDSENEVLILLREILQSLTLLGLWRSNFFEHAAFYGGTALRILYGLDRYSEDLDFSLLRPAENFSFERYKDSIVRELESFGFYIDFEVKKKQTASQIDSAFIKTNTFNQLIIIEAPERILSTINKRTILKIKLEVDTNPPPDFETEMKYVFSPIQFAVRTFTTPSLFAGKMHAVLCRKWKTRIKGRDWYDFAWYISQYPKLNLKHLEARMRQSGDYKGTAPLTKESLLALLDEMIDKFDISKAKEEVAPFVSNARSLDIWSKEFFKSAAQKIIFT